MNDDGEQGGAKRRNNEWDAFVSSLPEDQRARLVEAGFDLDDYHKTNLTKPHRLIYDDKFMDKRMTVRKVQPFSDSDTEIEGILSSIVAKIIAAYGCTNDPKVLLHNDCFRIALGYTNYASMADLAKRYKVHRATISYRVKCIQEELGLPPSIYMRSEQTCENAREGQLRRKR